MKAILKSSKRVLSMLLIVCMLASLLPAMLISVSAATALPNEGRGFDSDDDLALVKRLEVQPKTYEAVFYAPSDIKKTGVIFGNYYNNDTSCINFMIQDDGHPQIYLQDSAKNKMKDKYFDVDVRLDDWVHLVITHEINENGAVFNCYINGVPSGTITTDITYELDMAAVQFEHLLALGRDSRKGNAEYFKGEIKNVALYSDVLTADEIKASYESGVNTEDTSLIAYYQLDNTNADTIQDSTGNGYNLGPRFSPSTPIPSTDYDYSFAILGDTQRHVYNKAYSDNPNAEDTPIDRIYDWVVANKDTKKINFVIGLGDITDRDGKDNTSSSGKNPDDGINQKNIEWDIAVKQFKKLTDAGIPYSVIQGNHDSVAQLDNFFAGNDNFTNFANDDIGYYKGNSLGNYYVKFTVGSEKYMVVGLQYGPTDAMIAWAGEQIAANPDYKVIITTHAYLKNDAEIIDMFYGGTIARESTTASSTANNGNQIWTDLASQYENVIMVLAGHIPCADIRMRQDVGVNGNTVTQFLIDPQGMDVYHSYKTGMVAMFYFSNGGKTVQVEYVSTYHSIENNDGNDYIYNQEANKFTVNIPDVVAPSDVECEYGTIAANYSNPLTYPFVVFKTDKTFIGGYGELSDAINAIQAIGGADDYVIYMRKNAELRDAVDNLAGFKGTITVDLGGYKLLKATDGSVFYVYVDDNSGATLESGFDIGGKFVIKNGTVLKYGDNPIVAVKYGTNFANNYKVYFDFNNVTFIDKSGKDNNIFASLEDGNAGTACVYPYATFTDCTFDYTSSTVPPTMINLTNKDGYNRVVWDVQIKGGKIVSDTGVAYSAFVRADKGTVGREDKVVFVKGEDGKNLVLELPKAATVSTIWETDDGYMGFVKVESAEKDGIYELQTVVGYVTKYGVAPEEYRDGDKYPMLFFKNGVFIDAYLDFYEALKDAKESVEGNSGAGSTVHILFQADVTASNNYDQLGYSRGNIIFDLNNHTLTQEYDSYFLHLRALEGNISNATFEFCNGEIVLKNSTLLYFQSNNTNYATTANKTDYKNFNVEFNNVKFSYAEGSTATTFLAAYKAQSAMGNGECSVGGNITFNDCEFDFTNAALTKVMNAGYHHTNYNFDFITKVTVNGCKIITKNPRATLFEINADNGSSVTFDKGTDGKYLTMTVIGSNVAPTGTVNDGYLEFKSGEDDGNGNKTYALSLVGVTTKYGFVPKAYLDDVVKYPILLFKDGEFLGGYDVFIKQKTTNSYSGAFNEAKSLVDGTNDDEKSGSSVQLLFQADVNSDTYFKNLGQIHGTIVIDLNGHKLIQNYNTNPLFYTVAKYYCDGMGAPGLKICNGDIVLQTQLLYFGATDNAYKNAATDTNYKTFDLDFNNVKFTYAEGSAAETFLGIYTDSSLSGGKKVGYDVNFTDCVFDFTNAASMTKVMTAKDDAIAKCNSIVNVTVNGCEMITKTPGATLYEEHETNGSSVTFGKGTNDKYLAMTVVGTNEAPTGTANDGSLEFKKTGNNTYELTPPHTHNYNIPNYDVNNHWNECSCGDLDAVTPHSYDNNCDTSCACGYTRTAPHTPKSTYETNGTEHWKICSECSTEISGTRATHSYENNCDTTCDACGYTRTVGPHTPKTDYETSGTEHWKICSECSTEISGTRATHSYDNNCDTSCACGYTRTAPHTPKSTYETNGTEHWKICSECSTEISGTRGQHTGGTATCTAKKQCTDCGNAYGDKLPHEPNADDGDCTTAITCKNCPEVITEAKDAHVDSDSNGKCDVCDKQISTSTPDPDPIPEEPKDGLGTGAIIGIVVGGVAVVGIGGFALVWFVIKKKSPLT